jgi:hypothetical protein
MSLMPFKDIVESMTTHSPDYIKKNHVFRIHKSMFDMNSAVVCSCGWHQKFNEYLIIMEGVRPVVLAIVDHIDEKIAEEEAKLHPTIKDLEEWGWFNPS